MFPKVSLRSLLAAFVLFTAGISLAQQAIREELPDPSGMYEFFRDGEFIQLAVERDGTVQGSISRFASGDATSFVDHVFTGGSWAAPKLTFKTKSVHGVSFEFEGTVQRNEKQMDPTKDGFWIMKGKLTQTDAQNKKKTRNVEFKSQPNL